MASAGTLVRRSNEDEQLGSRGRNEPKDIEELIPEAMRIIGDGIEWDTFCYALNVTDDEARWLLHEMGHRLLAGFAGGWVSPSIYVVWSRRLAHRPEPESGRGAVTPIGPRDPPPISNTIEVAASVGPYPVCQ